MKTVTAYQIENCGVDHARYFPGRGTAFTNWEEVFVGCGDNPSEALDDALENAAQCDWDVSSINEGLSEESEIPEPEDDEDNEDCELYHYVALYLRRIRLGCKYVVEFNRPTVCAAYGDNPIIKATIIFVLGDKDELWYRKPYGRDEFKVNGTILSARLVELP